MSRRKVVDIGGGQFAVGDSRRPSERYINGRVVTDDGAGFVVSRDWDYPAAATRLGWSIRRVQRRGRDTRFLKSARKGKNNCEHSHTDGTIDCPDCGVKAIAFIEAAAEFLRERAQ